MLLHIQAWHDKRKTPLLLTFTDKLLHTGLKIYLKIAVGWFDVVVIHRSINFCSVKVD